MKKRNTGKSIIFAFYVVSFFYSAACYSQSYGVGFYSHEVIQDKRSSLDLFPNGPVCFDEDFEFSFDLSFLPGHKDYFGYIFRLIKDDKTNIDLICEHNSPHFSIIVGEKLSNIKFDIDDATLYKDWNNCRLKFDYKNDRLLFSVGTASFTQNNIGLKNGNCFKIYFGASQYKQFKVTDVPPMKIREVKLSTGGKLKYHWPLNEINGTTSTDIVSKTSCEVMNPVWIKSSHYDWKLDADFVISGYAAVAFNKDEDVLYITGKDSIYSFTAGDDLAKAVYRSGRQSMLIGNQGIYSDGEKKLYSIYVDQKLVTAFDFGNKKWNKLYKPGPVTDFWQFNKFFSSHDTSLYIIGGYGHYKYRNEIFRYHIPSDSFQAIEASGDRLIPRYLAGLGYSTSGDTAYILGGYGSLTGQQIVNPQNLYDLVLFDAKNKRLKKLFEIQKGKEEFVFANSLVVDEKDKSYYGLTFPNYKYNSQLQLIKGSIIDPSFTVVGNKIPYSFHDINSYADLFYSNKTNRFVAVTLLTDSSAHTRLKIYTLQGPPETAADNTASFAVSDKKSKSLYWLLLLVPVALIVWFIRKRGTVDPSADPVIKTGREYQEPRVDIAVEEKSLVEPVTLLPEPGLETHPDIFLGAVQHSNDAARLVEEMPFLMELVTPAQPVGENGEKHKSYISLFGEMQVIDKEGADITKYFTPLIKELFLIIVLYTLKKGRGISSEKLNEILWFDKSAQSARNNRSVNIAKLKNILEKVGEVSLSKDTGYWKLEYEPNELRIDFEQYLGIVRNKEQLDKQKIMQLANITQAGNFLSNIEYEWLDKFKSEVSNEIIDTYLHFATSLNINEDSELLLKIAQYIFNFDPVNEEAMIIRCKAFAHLGKHTLAKNAFEIFSKEYRLMYGEDFRMSFQTVVGV